MKLTQDNLDRHGALYHILYNGEMVGVEPCESEGDIEMPLYVNYGSADEPEWEQKPSESYGHSPYADLSELLAAHPDMGKWNTWKHTGEVNFR